MKRYIVSLFDDSDHFVDAGGFYISDGVLWFENETKPSTTDKNISGYTKIVYLDKPDIVACYNQGTWKNVRLDGKGKELS